MRIHRESGNVLLVVLVFIAVVGISFSSMIDYVLSQKRQTVKTASIFELKFAMDSAVDFVLFGVKQKYCFTDSLMSDMNCNITHAGSTERLIMSPEQVNFMVAAGKITTAQGQNLRIGKISRDLEIANVTPAHPLYGVLNALQTKQEMKNIRFLHVEIERNDSVFLPRTGNEVYLKISVALAASKGGTGVLEVGNQKLTVISNSVIYPREVGSFALLVPRDLYVGSNQANPAFGDTHFYGGPNAKAQLAGSSGLVFLSPVFVNRNVFVNQSGYSPVTFADRVYMGEGKVMSGNAPYKPTSNGGTGERYWRDIASFGGFLKGLENDGATDAGLNVYAGGISASTPANEDLMKRCIERNLSQADLSKILNSHLSVSLQGSGPYNFNYFMKLTNSEFEGQRMDPRVVRQYWGKGSVDLNYDSNYQKTVMDVTLKVGTRSTTFTLSKNATSVAVAEVGSIQYENSLRAALEAAKKALADAMNNPDSASSNIQALQAAVLEAQKKLDDYLYKVAHPPKITIDTDPVQRKYSVSNSKLNFGISIENAASMLDVNGNLVNPVISVKSFDSGYIDGGFIGNRNDAWRRGNNQRFIENPNIDRTLSFTVDANSAAINAPTGIPVTTPTDYEDLGDLCMGARDAQESQAFGMSDANVSFANTVRHSWNFAGTGSELPATKTDPLVNSIQFDSSNSLKGAGNTTFQVRSIVGTCTIKAGANFVAGFFMCDRLVIEQRSTPLRIIGTFIAGNVIIHPSAFTAGIIWSSIYHPQSVVDLRAEGILKRASDGGACVSSISSPVWNPVPSIQEVVDRIKCNVISLRSKADPFQWTAVDPDCGMLPGKSNMSCKKRLVRFFVIEQSREEGK